MTDADDGQAALRATCREFVAAEVAPYASQFDREERISKDVIRKLAEQGYLTPWLPPDHGGLGMDMVSYGLVTEEVGYACSSTRSLLTVLGMAAQAILRCGNARQNAEHLPLLASGKRLAAVAITEPNVGSNAARPETTARRSGDGYSITGKKSWISFSQIADLFLLLASCDGKPTAFLIDRDLPGVEVTPISGLLGARGSMLADIAFTDCLVPMEARLGAEGAGFSMVILTALDHGRYSVAWGCVGLIRACLEACTAYTSTRQQFGKELRHHQLVKRVITNMVTSLHCADLLCRKCGQLRDQGDPRAHAEVMIAKYFASVAAKRAASDAVQLHGANGCSDRYSVERFYRDAKVMEIIEGSTQIQQMTIADYAYQQYLSA
jgi:alkylation response protein AidB-like acyl-CoA dehydrogenase